VKQNAYSALSKHQNKHWHACSATSVLTRAALAPRSRNYGYWKTRGFENSICYEKRGKSVLFLLFLNIRDKSNVVWVFFQKCHCKPINRRLRSLKTRGDLMFIPTGRVWLATRNVFLQQIQHRNASFCSRDILKWYENKTDPKRA